MKRKLDKQKSEEYLDCSRLKDEKQIKTNSPTWQRWGTEREKVEEKEKKMRCQPKTHRPRNVLHRRCSGCWRVLWVMAELAYAGEGTIRKAYSRDQETLPTQTHRDLHN